MSYQALELDGSGYATIADASQKGLNMGLSDFMIEGWVKLTKTAANQKDWATIIRKRLTDTGYWLATRTSSRIQFYFGDATSNVIQNIDSSYLDNLQWHYFVVIGDRSSATGGKFFIDGFEVSYIYQDDISVVGNVDNAGPFQISRSGLEIEALTDELRIWNFGYGGLPGDYAAYITWRAAGRNRFLDISNYNGGAWNGYADALRTERMTLGDLDDDNSDFEGAGADGTDITVGTDWEKIRCSIEIDDGGGSGVTSYNGSDFSVKIHTASGDFPQMLLQGANLDNAFVVGDWYEFSFDYKTLNCTDAKIKVSNVTGTIILTNLTSITWTTYREVFQVTGDNDMKLWIYPHYGADEVGNEVVWIDKISIKRIGLVARYKFSGNYNDETANANHLTAGGSGNTFPGYSLRSKAQKMLLGVG